MTQGHVKENTVASYFSPSVILYRRNQTGFPFLLHLGLDVLPAEREALTGGDPGVHQGSSSERQLSVAQSLTPSCHHLPLSGLSALPKIIF